MRVLVLLGCLGAILRILAVLAMLPGGTVRLHLSGVTVDTTRHAIYRWTIRGI